MTLNEYANGLPWVLNQIAPWPLVQDAASLAKPYKVAKINLESLTLKFYA